MDNKYNLHDDVYIDWSSTKMKVHEVIQNSTWDFVYRLWNKWTTEYLLMDEYQLISEYKNIWFNTD